MASPGFSNFQRSFPHWQLITDTDFHPQPFSRTVTSWASATGEDWFFLTDI